jgi:hypothetical protein
LVESLPRLLQIVQQPHRQFHQRRRLPLPELAQAVGIQLAKVVVFELQGAGRWFMGAQF